MPREALVRVGVDRELDRICILLERRQHAMRLRIADNGLGFPFRGERSMAEMIEGGSGPRSMRERVSGLQGAFSLRSEATGTTLEILLPVQAARHADHDHPR